MYRGREYGQGEHDYKSAQPEDEVHGLIPSHMPHDTGRNAQYGYKKKDIRPGYDHTGYGDPLLLTAAQFVRVTILKPLKSHKLENFMDPLIHFTF